MEAACPLVLTVHSSKHAVHSTQGLKLRMHQLGAIRLPCCTSMYQGCTYCLTCCRCQQVPRLAVAWRGRVVATAAALPQELTAAFLRVGAEAMVCAREPGQDAAAQAAFFRSFYGNVLGGRLSIVDALSAAGEALPAAVCQPPELPHHGLRAPATCHVGLWHLLGPVVCRHTACDRLLCSGQLVISCFLSLSILQSMLACTAGDAVPALRGSFACYHLLEGQVSEAQAGGAAQPETLLKKTAVGLQQTADLFVRRMSERMSDSLALMDPFLSQDSL